MGVINIFYVEEKEENCCNCKHFHQHYVLCDKNTFLA